MSIQVTCGCGQRFQAQPHLYGKRVQCPTCGGPLDVPSPRSTVSSTREKGVAGAAAILVGCACGQRFKARPELVGRTVGCPSCGQPLTVRRESMSEVPASQNPLDLGSVDARNDPLSEVGAYSASAPTLSTLRPPRPASKPFPVRTVAWILSCVAALVLIAFVLVYAGKAIHTAYRESVAKAEQPATVIDSSQDDPEEPKASDSAPSANNSVRAGTAEKKEDGSAVGKAMSAAVDTFAPDLSTPTGVYNHSIDLAQQERFEDLYDLYSKNTQTFYDSNAAAEGYASGREYFGAVMAKIGKQFNYVCANPQFKEKRSGNRCTLTVSREHTTAFVAIDLEFVREGAFWKFHDEDPRAFLDFIKRLEKAAAGRGFGDRDP